jgi:hypothetical protein
MPDVETMTTEQRIQAYLSKMTKADIIDALWASLKEMEAQTQIPKTPSIMNVLGAEDIGDGWQLPTPTQAAKKVRGSFK